MIQFYPALSVANIIQNLPYSEKPGRLLKFQFDDVAK